MSLEEIKAGLDDLLSEKDNLWLELTSRQAALLESLQSAGQLAPILGMTPAQAAFNWAILPGWQKWKPTYRVGEIIEINYDQNTADIELDEALSVAQSLNVNQAGYVWDEINEEWGIEESKPILYDVPVEYMLCDAGAFIEGDRVVVEFSNQNWEDAKVIGFEENPQPCSGPAFKVIDSEYNPLGLLICVSGRFGPPYHFVPYPDESGEIGFEMADEQATEIQGFDNSSTNYLMSHEFTGSVSVFDDTHCSSVHTGISKRTAKRTGSSSADRKATMHPSGIIVWTGGLEAEHEVNWTIVGATATLNAGYGLPVEGFINTLTEAQEERLLRLTGFTARSLWGEGGAPNIAAIVSSGGGYWYSSRSEVSNLDPAYDFEEDGGEYAHSTGFFPWDVSYLSTWDNKTVHRFFGAWLSANVNDGVYLLQTSRKWGQKSYSTPDECKLAAAYCPYGANPLDVGLANNAGTTSTEFGTTSAELSVFGTKYQFLNYSQSQSVVRSLESNNTRIKLYTDNRALVSAGVDLWQGQNIRTRSYEYFSFFDDDHRPIDADGNIEPDIKFETGSSDTWLHSLGVQVMTESGLVDAYCEGEVVYVGRDPEEPEEE